MEESQERSVRWSRTREGVLVRWALLLGGIALVLVLRPGGWGAWAVGSTALAFRCMFELQWFYQEWDRRGL